MDRQRIGFLGFGTVGKTFARTLVERAAALHYYDVRGPSADVAGYLPLAELVAASDILMSTVVTHAALPAAQDAAGLLGPGKTYVDFNSTSPATKIAIGDCITGTGAEFVDAAILGPVAAAGAKAVILLAGPSAEAAVPRLQELGLTNVRYLSPRYGDAALVKMLRSVFSKGAECLLIEMLTAAQRAGVAGVMWREIMGWMAENPFEKVAANWVKTHVTACDRRQHEMAEVVETLHELGIEPLMSGATRAFFERSVALQPGEEFPRPPDDVMAVPAFFARRLPPGD